MKRYILSVITLLASFGLMAQEKTDSIASVAPASDTTPTPAPKAKVKKKVQKPPLMDQNKFLSLSLGGGISTLKYDFPYGEKDFGLGGRLNIDYNIFVNRLVGISFGIGGSKMNATANFDSKSKYVSDILLPVIDNDGDEFEFVGKDSTLFQGWSESQSVFALEVPLGTIFRVPVTKKFTILAGAGVKLSFPLKASYKVKKEGSYLTSVYNEDLNVWFEDLPEHGISVNSVYPSGSTDTKIISAGVYLDANLVQRIGRINLYYGIYGDLGLTNIAKREKSLTTNMEYNGVLISDAVDKIIPFSAGVRVGVKIPCPRLKDEDRDGVLDIYDNCPNTPAGLPVDTCGCPLDTDGDGVYDYLDRCGDTPNGVVVDTCGCPVDSDGDGVPDHLDKCPYTPKNTPVDSHGCPFDADGDGVPDYADKCPNTPEGVKVDQDGCPFDTDGDGVPDYLDKCPTIPGVESNQGCPEISETARKAFKNAEHGIEFEPGTANLIRSSCQYIDKIISIMREYPNYRLVVNGHTDGTGSMAVNLKVSKRRAMAIVDYMVERGIYPSRLKSFGHGGTQPIGDNKTVAGRKLNNRIEFKVEFDQ